MKVFDFDPMTGKKGECVAEMNRPLAMSLKQIDGVFITPECKLPKSSADTNWSVFTVLKDKLNNEITFDRPVCFCMGQWTVGTDTAWEWVVYLP